VKKHLDLGGELQNKKRHIDRDLKVAVSDCKNDFYYFDRA